MRTSRNGVHLRLEAYAKIIHLEGEGFVMVPVGLALPVYAKIIHLEEEGIVLVPGGLELPVYTGNRYQRKPGEQWTQISLWPEH